MTAATMLTNTNPLRGGTALVGLLALVLAGLVAAPRPASATPVATDAGTYASYQRVFPDPQGCRQGEPGTSPYAQGTVCATDFIQHSEALAGLEFLRTIDPAEFPGLYPDGGRPFAEFMEIQRLEEAYADVLDLAAGDGQSAGLPQPDGSREQFPLHMIKVTDSASDIPEPEREHFVFSLSIHGIERAGAEGGIRAIEDLVTWGASDPGRPLVETDPSRSVSVGEALRRSVIYFTLSNPDGWVRGDTAEGGVFYQRYNGNGVDLNRDWPAQGYTFRPYTPWSEPETRSFGRVLQHLKDETAAGRFTGGNDLHGQLIDRAFSFTLIGSVTRPFDKDEEAVQVMQRIWADQETRLAWSPIIKPNSAPVSCVEPGTSPDVNPQPDCDPTNRVYADQWGTVWDTIDYTVTGAMGDWFDSPIGLDALGLDNEMSLSHLSNCGLGKCFDQHFEQLHVDGNKGLIYSQINLQLQPPQPIFSQPGRTAYLLNPNRVVHEGAPPPAEPPLGELPPQEDVEGTITQPPNTPLEFEVLGPDDGVYSGGFTVEVTAQNVQAVSTGMTGVIVERRRDRGDEPDPEQPESEWEEINRDYNQAPTYLQAGFTVNVNAPRPGTWRVRLDNPPPGAHQVSIDFTTAQSWPDPGQVPYDVSNMDFFPMLNAHSVDGFGFTPVTVDQILGGDVDLDDFDTLVLAEDFMPGWRPEVQQPTGDPQEPITGSTAAAAPGAGSRNPATSVFFEFDVVEGANNAQLTGHVVPTAPADLDLYVQRQAEDGSWSGDLAAGESGSLSEESVTVRGPEPGHYRLEIHNWAGPAGNPVDIEITFAAAEPIDEDELEPLVYSDAQRDEFLGELSAFGAAGGLLLLTDGAIDVLRYLPAADGSAPLFEEAHIQRLEVYAGHIEFNDSLAAPEGEEGDAASQARAPTDDPAFVGERGPTYARYDLAQEVNRPGAAEGDNNRHQAADPVPTGYAIQDAGGSDLNTHPNWVVDQAAWEGAGGITVGTSQDGAGVSLGELDYGDGRIRVIGSLLPMPTEEFDHPYGLAPYGLTYTGYQVFDNALRWVRPGGHWRLAGRNRYETAVEVALHHWNTIDSVVIASGEDFPDALAAVPLARLLDAPILLTRPDGLPDEVYAYLLARNPQATTAYVVGGEAAVGEQVIADLERVYIPAEGITRLGGANRFETAVAIAEELAALSETPPTQAVVTTGERYPDALAAGPVAANLGPENAPVPLLLTGAGQLPESVAAYLESAGITSTLIAGGEQAVSAEVEAALPEPSRVGGTQRFETAVLLAQLLAELRGDPVRATVATGTNFPDALVVGSAGGREGIPTLLATRDDLATTPSTHAWLRDHGAALREVYLAGGPAVLSDAIAAGVEDLTGR